MDRCEPSQDLVKSKLADGPNIAREKSAILGAMNDLDTDISQLSDQLFGLDDKLFPVSSQTPTEDMAVPSQEYVGSSDLYNYIRRLNDTVVSLQAIVRSIHQRVEV